MKMEINKPLEGVVRTLMKLRYEPILWDDNKAELVTDWNKRRRRFHCKINSNEGVVALDLHEDRIMRGYCFSSSHSEAVKKECQRLKQKI